MNWKHWYWLEDVLLPLTLLTMRVCAVWLWLVLIQHLLIPSYDGTLLPVWLMVVLLMGSRSLTRIALQKSPTLAQARLIVAAVGITTLIFLLWWQLYSTTYSFWQGSWLEAWGYDMLFWVNEIPPAYLLLPAVVYLWVRGIIDGTRHLEHHHIQQAFVGGCIGLLLLMLASLVDQKALPSQAGSLIFLFFAMAMIALALSGLKVMRLPLLGGERQGAPQFNRYWAGSVATIIIILLFIGLALSGLFTPELLAPILAWIWNLLSTALILLIKIISLILYPVLYILSVAIPRLYEAILGTIGGFFGEFAAENRQTLEELAQQERREPIAEFLNNLPDAWRWVAIAAVFSAIALIFAIVLRRLMPDPADEEFAEEREFILSTNLLLDQLGQWLPNLFGRRGQTNPFLSLADESATRRTIRQVYQQLLTAAQAQDRPRLRYQTPAEYGRVLTQLWANHDDALDLITKQYTAARYAVEPPTAEQAQQTQQAWADIQKDLERTKQ